jgi:hypothetical protein
VNGAAVVLVVINYVILYFVIRVAVGSATSETMRMRHVEAQTELLMALAHRHGVDPGTLGAIAYRLNPAGPPGPPPSPSPPAPVPPGAG